MSANPTSLQVTPSGLGSGDSAPPDVHLEGVTKRFGAETAVDDLTLSIDRGAFFAIIGPSGCGKTTTLRMIGGFEQPTAGRIFIGGEDVTDRAPHRRDVNTVFQSYALFPHLTVERNVAYGLERRGVKRAEVRSRVADALELVQLSTYGRRRPGELSGGEQQRVALARAIVNRPRALLLDEPLGALDLRLRKGLQVELKRLQHELEMTFVHVTHDQEEAMSMAETIVVVSDGRIEQAGSPVELYERPRTAFVARFLGVSNLVSGRITGSDNEVTVIETHDGATLRARAEVADQGRGEAVQIGVRPEKVTLLPAAVTPEPGANVLRGHVALTAFLGVLVQYVIRTPGGDELTVLVQNHRRSEAEVATGDEVQLAWNHNHTFVVPEEAT